ncbi:hypothetical protein Pelo_17091 [Pelomyxa schiedti]|nr:hypothetical protein Pelo_17091 [Pelomyxa schiedti]
MVSLCTSAYLSLSSSAPSQVKVGTTKGDEGDVNIECRVCHRVTTLSVREVFASAPVDARHHHHDGKGASHQVTCVLHPDRPLEIFCVTDKILVCLECALEHHCTHELVTITRQAQATTEQCPLIVEFINKERARMEKLAQQTECDILSLTERKRRAEGYINGTINRLVKRLLKKRDTLLANTSKVFESINRALDLKLKCAQSAVCQLNESQNQLKVTAACKSQTGGIIIPSSLVIITECSPVLTNYSNWKTSVEQLRDNTLPLLSAQCEGRLHIKQDIPPGLRCIINMSISSEFQQAFGNCLAMFPCPSHGPLCEICATTSKVCSRVKKTHNLSETVSLVLLCLMLSFKPSLSESLGPFTKHPGTYIRSVLLPKCSPESQVFTVSVIDAALSLVLQPPPPEQPQQSRPVTSSTSRSEPQQSDWKCGVAALAHVMRGYMYRWGVGGVRMDTTKALQEYNEVISSCLGESTTSSPCLNVPNAVAENLLGWVLYGSSPLLDPNNKTRVIEHFEVSAHLGHVTAQGNLGWLHLTGYSSPGGFKNVSEAVKWLGRASEGGDAWGQYHLAQLYETGCVDAGGVRKDVTEAMRLYRLSADQGWDEAQYRLGAFLVDGTATTDSRGGGGLVQTQRQQKQQWKEEGVRLLLLAADQGNNKAKDKLKTMKTLLP